MALVHRGSTSVDSSQTRLPSAMTQQSSPSADPAESSRRSRKQFGLFLAGASFFALSTLITRRTLVRKYQRSIPPFYHPSNRSTGQVNGAVEAFEALNIATINVCSVSMMVTGGTLWAFDISTLEDLRRRVRGGLGVDGSGQSANGAEEEMEEWLATVLARKEEKDRKRKDVSIEQRPTNERGAPR